MCAFACVVAFNLFVAVAQTGSIVPELGLEFNGCWGAKSATLVLRCILEDVLKDEDFLLNNGQYLLAVHIIDQVMMIMHIFFCFLCRG